MSDEQTCGKGLAAHAVLPRKLGAVAESMAAVLEHHRKSLDVTGAKARAEDDAYTIVANGLREAAATLAATAERMAGYRDLPMAPHDESVLMTDEANATFEELVRAERDLQQLLEDFAKA